MEKKGVVSLFILCALLYGAACQRRHICPAYHSSFILDQHKTREFFSIIGEDSLPKSSLFVNKNKSGIIVKLKFHKKQKNISTVKMKMVYPPPVDSMALAQQTNHAGNGENEAETDSILNTPARLFGFNREQEVYMSYIAPFYHVEEPLTEETGNREEQSVPAEEQPKKKKRWFWNKNNEKEDDHTETEPPENLTDF